MGGICDSESNAHPILIGRNSRRVVILPGISVLQPNFHGRLGRVQDPIRSVVQSSRRVVPGNIDLSNADSNRELELLAGGYGGKWPVSNTVPQSLCSGHCRIDIGFRHDDDEFFAAVARHRIKTLCAFHNSGAKLLEHHVTCGMALRFIDLLEMVDVEHDHR